MIRVHHDLASRFAAPDGHQQCVQPLFLRQFLDATRPQPGRECLANGAPHLADAHAELPSEGLAVCWRTDLPALRERIDQGGTIALIIISLGILGMLMALWRGLYLTLVFQRIRKQLRNASEPQASNPLGRVLLAVEGVNLDDDELLEVTPSNLRLRKKLLTETYRKRESRRQAS